MKPILDFDPTVGTFGVIDTKGVNRDEQLMLYNDSTIGFTLEFPDGSKAMMPPSWNKDFIIKTVPMDKVKWTFFNKLQATGWPISQVYGEIYEPGEHVASVNSAMQRGVTSTGGSVSTVGSTLSNEGGALTDEIIDFGTVANPKLWDVSRQAFQLATEIAGVRHPIVTGSLTGSPAQMGKAGDVMEFLGNLLIDGTINIASLTTVNGSVAGNYQVSFPFWGASIKLMILTLHGYTSALKNIALPSNVSRAFIVATDFGGGSPILQPKNGAAAVGFSAITAFGGAGNGTEATVAFIHQAAIGSIPSTIDNFDFTPGTLADGTVIMIGH